MIGPLSGNRPLTAHKSSKVSVLVAAYGMEKYLDETLQSLLKQTYSNWEAIIVDDGSPDNVAAVARKFADKDERIKFYHTDNHGVGAARNYAASKASGEYVMCLDGDDLILPEYISRCAAELDSRPSLKVAYTDWDIFGNNQSSFALSYNGFREELIHNQIHVSAMMRLDDFRRVGGFDVKMEDGFEDWEFWIRVLKDSSSDCVRLIPEKLFRYRQMQKSRNHTVEASAERLGKCRRYIFSKHQILYNTFFPMYISADLLGFTDMSFVDFLQQTKGKNGNELVLSEIRDGINWAKRLARGGDTEFNNRYIRMLSSQLCDVSADCLDQLSPKQIKRLRLLTENPHRFASAIRRWNRMLPKNWFCGIFK